MSMPSDPNLIASKFVERKKESQTDRSFIQRAIHDKNNPYVVISRKLLFDKRLKSSPRLLLCALLSLPDNWKLRPAQIAKRIGMCLDTIYSGLNKLIEAGYCTKEEIRNTRGHRVGFTYYITEEPTNAKELSTQKPKRKKPNWENTGTINNDNDIYKEIYSSNDNDRESNLSITPPPSSPPPPTIDPNISRDRPSSKDNLNIVFSPDTYRLPNGQFLSIRMRRALNKYRGADKIKLLANIAYAEDRIKKGGIANQEAYLQQCITNDYAAGEERKETNRLWATLVINQYKIPGCRVRKTCFEMATPHEQISIQLEMDSGLFAARLREYMKHYRGFDPDQLLVA